MLFAQAQGSQILWVRAVDFPNTSEDKGMDKEKLDQLRREWLRLHNRQTGGVMGLLPCTWNLLVRFTHTQDKAKGVVKYARARLVRWELQDVDKERVAGSADPELLLSRAPRRLFLELKEKTGEGTQIYALAPHASNFE